MGEYVYQDIQLSIDDLSVNLSNFNGPLDVLLHLVKEAKIEIKDIFMSEITAQFLSYMTQIDNLDVNKASEYMEMAATLLEIKSRALLPIMPSDENNEDTPEKILIRQLEEYKLFKEVSERLKTQENVDRLYKEPDMAVEGVVYSVKDMSLDTLLDAFAGILHKVELNKLEQNNPKQIKKDSYSVSEKLRYIRTKLSQQNQLDFFDLCDESGEISEVVVTFIALLELLKLQLVKVEQKENFDSITVIRTNEINEDLLNYEELN